MFNPPLEKRKLKRLQRLKFRRSTSKMEVFGRVYLFVCVWMVEIIGILEADLSPLRSLDGWARILVFVAICVALGIFDVIYKLIFKHDATVMDSFLKTKPIPASVWEKYLVVSQLWHPDNLMMPLLVMPLCFAIFHFGWGLVAVLVLNMLSVAIGIFLINFVSMMLGGMGLLGFALHRPALGWVERRFPEIQTRIWRRISPMWRKRPDAQMPGWSGLFRLCYVLFVDNNLIQNNSLYLQLDYVFAMGEARSQCLI